MAIEVWGDGGERGTAPTVDAVSKALRVTQYDKTGRPNEFAGSYMCRIECIPSTVTAGTIYFLLRNFGPRTAFLRRLELKCGFAGTVGATRSLFELTRAIAIGASVGTMLLPAKKSNEFMPPSCCAAIYGPVVTTAPIAVVEPNSPGALFGVTHQLNADHEQDFDFTKMDPSKWNIAPNESFVIRANTTIVSGAYFIGMLTWDEKFLLSKGDDGYGL